MQITNETYVAEGPRGPIEASPMVDLLSGPSQLPPYEITTALIADMLANASNIRTAVSGGFDYIPRALACETAGTMTAVWLVDGAEVTITGIPLIAGSNPYGGMHRITAFTGTNLRGLR